MSRLRLLGLLALVSLTIGVTATVGISSATFTTSSQSTVSASAERISNWLNLFSQGSDPTGLTGYATQRVQSGVAPLCATGLNETLSLTMGGIRTGTSYTFTRAFTIAQPPTFPDPSVTTVTISTSLIADATGKQPISAVNWVYVGSSQEKLQANITLNASGTGWVVGQTYHPSIRVTMTYTGGPSGYYIYTIPLAVTIVSW